MRTQYIFKHGDKQVASIWSEYEADAMFKFMARLVDHFNKDFFEVFGVARDGWNIEQAIKEAGYTIEIGEMH